MSGSSTLPKGPLYDPEGKIKNLVRGEDFKKINLTCKRLGILYAEGHPLPNPREDMVWRRPKDICHKPFFVDGKPSMSDALQGDLEDCWVVAAMQGLALNEELFNHVVPSDQSFDVNYTGAFHFRIWQLGVWYDVVVDDRLPVDSRRPQLIFSYSRNRNVFWASLLEKAYSKVCNKLYVDYFSLSSAGVSLTSLQDFSGGIIEQVRPTKPPPGRDFNWFLNEVISNRAIVTCSFPKREDAIDIIRSTGLRPIHAYVISRVFYTRDNDPEYHGLCLIKLTNPWGRAEFSGEWNDEDIESWQRINETIRGNLQLKVENDGEFWMSEEDFKRYFNKIQVCHLGPGQYFFSHYGYHLNTWSTTAFRGEWVKGVSAGGSQTDKLHINPQFKIQLKTPDNDADGLVSVVIELTQRDRLREGTLIYRCHPAMMVGLYIYLLVNNEEKQDRLNQEFFVNNRPRNEIHFPVKGSKPKNDPVFGRRACVVSLTLAQGWYCMVPFAKHENREGIFLIRVFAESNVEKWEYDTKISKSLPTKESPDNYVLNEELKPIFDEAAKNGEVDWIGLKAILEKEINLAHDSILKRFWNSMAKGSILKSENESGRVFSKDECRSMIAMLDQDNSGKLNYHEFCSLWRNIHFWYRVFDSFGESEGYLKVDKLRDALGSAGFNLNEPVINSLVHFYANEEGFMNLTDFILCGIVLETFYTRFSKDKIDKGLNLTLEEWVKITLAVL